MTLLISRGFNGVTDPDAATYVAAVEAADGQLLENAVGKAINAFVIGCKNDGIWNAIKASCILAGARTLAGALVPLAGTAPTNNNFVSGDYNRKTGLVGDGSTKYLNSNRPDSSDPQNNNHISVYVKALPTLNDRTVIGSLAYGVTGAHQIFYRISDSSWYVQPRNSIGVALRALSGSSNLVGYSRSASSTITFRSGNGSTSSSITSQAPTSNAINIFSQNPAAALSDARLAFYSIGESLDLALLDARVTTLINAFAAAIP